MSKRKNRPQRSKPHRNEDLYRAMQELRRSNATVPVPNKNKYRREDWRRKAQAGKYED